MTSMASITDQQYRRLDQPETSVASDPEHHLDRNASRARDVARYLKASGVRSVAISIVDNAGVARVKTVPIRAWERSARWGVGLSPVFDVCTVSDTFTATPQIGGPVGDLRLIADAAAVRLAPAQPGWAWVPADQYAQDGFSFAGCQRSFAQRMTERARASGIDVRLGFEIEWFAGRQNQGQLVAAHDGPAYGLATLAQLAEYMGALVEALEAAGVAVAQLHPEYGAGQLEVSLPAIGPVAAADLNVFTRHTIRAVSAQHGLAASFAPIVQAGQVGNGAHVHLSAWRHDRNLLAGGPGPHGLTSEGEAFLAGVLEHLPALVAIGAPSVASYLRLQPSRWAGAYACWGRENREAALRLVTGMKGSHNRAANAEIKCFDHAANPYLVAGSVIAAGLDGIHRELRLPPEVTHDPAATNSPDVSGSVVRRLPSTLGEAVTALLESVTLRAALGATLFDAFVAVRQAELEMFGSMDPDQLIAAHRWKY
jgi:glutamine synthetase